MMGLCRSRLTLASYRALLSPNGWGCASALIRATRRYAEGLAGGFRLLAATETFRPRLARAEYRENRDTLLLWILEMLDRSDRWEEYLKTFAAIREHEAATVLLARDALPSHGERIVPYLAGPVDTRWVQVHIVYGQEHRRAIIARKLARLQNGNSPRRDRHAREEDLTSAEVERRLFEVLEWAA